MGKRFRADYSLLSFKRFLLLLLVLAIALYLLLNSNNLWSDIIFILLSLLFISAVTVREYNILEEILEIRYFLPLFKKKIAIADIVGLKKIKRNTISLDMLRSFEVINVKENDIDQLIEELLRLNPMIVYDNEEEGQNQEQEQDNELDQE